MVFDLRDIYWCCVNILIAAISGSFFLRSCMCIFSTICFNF